MIFVPWLESRAQLLMPKPGHQPQAALGLDLIENDDATPRGDMRVLQVAQMPQRRGAEIFAFDLSKALETQAV